MLVVDGFNDEMREVRPGMLLGESASYQVFGCATERTCGTASHGFEHDADCAQRLTLHYDSRTTTVKPGVLLSH
jgi:hypothetical protein